MIMTYNILVDLSVRRYHGIDLARRYRCVVIIMVLTNQLYAYTALLPPHTDCFSYVTDLSHICGHCWQQPMQAWSKTNHGIWQNAVNTRVSCLGRPTLWKRNLNNEQQRFENESDKLIRYSNFRKLFNKPRRYSLTLLWQVSTSTVRCGMKTPDWPPSKNNTCGGSPAGKKQTPNFAPQQWIQFEPHHSCRGHTDRGDLQHSWISLILLDQINGLLLGGTENFGGETHPMVNPITFAPIKQNWSN